MTESSLRERLDELVVDEPPLRIHFGEILADGRRRRRIQHARRGILGAVSVSTLAAAVALPLAVANNHGSARQTLSIRPFAMSGAQLPAVADHESGLTAAQQRVADAIRAASPSGWTFDMSSDRWDGLGVEATADDGTGAGRLMIGVSTGDQLVHPCQDSEFRAGASCTERTLDDGSVLTLRGLIDYHGIKYVDVVLTHPDGSGVMAESGNFAIDWPPPRVVTPEQKKHLERITRNDPPYSADQLAKVVVQVDAATH